MSLILLDLCLRKHKKYALYFQWFKWLPEIAACVATSRPASCRAGFNSHDDFAPQRQPERPKRYAQPEPEREAAFAEKLKRLKSARALYHQQRYGKNRLPEPRQIDMDDSAPEIEPLNDYAQRVLGDDAILATGDTIREAPSTERQRRREEMREEEEALARGHHQRRHL